MPERNSPRRSGPGGTPAGGAATEAHRPPPFIEDLGLDRPYRSNVFRPFHECGDTL